MRCAALVVVGCLQNTAFAEFVCGPAPKTCKIYLSAKAVFTGKVIEVDQRHGLVRLQVQESLKGIPQGTGEVWIAPFWSGPRAWIEDEGPMYRLGDDWLVFAYEFDSKGWGERFGLKSFDFADKSIYSDHALCDDAGSRLRNSPTVNSVLMELRGYRDGKPLPRGCRLSKAATQRQ